MQVGYFIGIIFIRIVKPRPDKRINFQIRQMYTQRKRYEKKIHKASAIVANAFKCRHRKFSNICTAALKLTFLLFY